jgi:hypothetical protein
MLCNILFFNDKSHDRNRITLGDGVMLLLVTFHAQGYKCDCFKFRARRTLQCGESVKSIGVHFKFCIIVYDVGSALRNHRRIGIKKRDQSGIDTASSLQNRDLLMRVISTRIATLPWDQLWLLGELEYSWPRSMSR